MNEPAPRRPAAETRGVRTWVVVAAALAVVALVAVVAVFASGGSDDSSSSSRQHETGPVGVEGTSLPQFDSSVDDPAVGKSIPTITGRTFDGTPITIGPSGKPQLVLFVAHWCPHCQAEVPRIVTLADAGKLSGVEVRTVATGTSSNQPNYPPSAWLQRESWPYPVLADSPKYAAADAFGLSAYPYFVFVDAQGKVVARTSGEIAPDDLAKSVAALAAGTLRAPSSGASSSR